MRELGVIGFGTILLNFWPKSMNIMGLCTVYTVIKQGWVVGGLFSCPIMHICLMRLC